MSDEFVDVVVEEAREFLKCTEALPFPEEIEPSEIWVAHLQRVVKPLIDAAATSSEIVAAATGQNLTTYPADLRAPGADAALELMARWLAECGHPLEEENIEETDLAADYVVTTVNSRLVSYAFLYQLRMAHRILDEIPDLRRVLELGSGYGGLARIIKLKRPHVQFVLLDLPETLFLVHVYLRRCFPDNKFWFAKSAAETADIPSDADFAFVPAQLTQALVGQQFDILINTASLSEMTQPAVDFYLTFFQKYLALRYFYNVNRYGRYEETTIQEQMLNTCWTSFGLDQHWEVVAWHWDDRDSMGRMSQWIGVSVLELLVRRTMLPPTAYRLMARNLEAEARTADLGSYLWHRLMWNAVRYQPTPRRLAYYIRILFEQGWREMPYYQEKLLDCMEADAMSDIRTVELLREVARRIRRRGRMALTKSDWRPG